jgi:Transglutaminase-like superfamily
MRLIHFLRTFNSLNREMRVLMIEAYFELCCARIFKLLPIAKTSKYFGNYMEETPFITNSSDKKILKRISEAIHIMSRHTFWESQCMVKAIAGMRMLKKRKIDCTIYFGTGKDESGKMCAHAWLRSGSFYISGEEEKHRFTVVGKFAKNVQR